MEQISLQPGWPRDAWPVLAADMALENNYQQAWSLAAANVQLIPPERNPSDPGLSRLRNLFSTRKSPETAEMLAKALFLKSDWDGVMEMASKNKTGPVLRMASLAAAKLNFWHEAWNYLVEAIQIEDESFTPE